MKKILVVDESALFLDYISKKLEENGFEVVQGKNGLDGTAKMRSEMPDLMIIDYFLSRKSSIELLKEKKQNRNVSGIPVIMLASKIDRSKLIQAAQFGVRKFLSKPIKIDSLMMSIAELLKVEVDIDSTPCIIEAHLNGQILFVEIARGLNKEKIEMLQYKIKELLDLYEVNNPRVVLMMSDLELGIEDQEKFKNLLDTIIEHAGPMASYMKILTTSEYAKQFISSDNAYASVGVTDDVSKAMDDLLGLKPDDIAHDEVVHDRLLSATAPKKERVESFQMRFDAEGAEVTGDESEAGSPEKARKTLTVAVVDDDPIMQQLIKTVFQRTGWTFKTYNNGREFIGEIEANEYDLVFLDLMMPEMNGFQVLQFLKQKEREMPIIVLSALSQQETVVKALSFGIHSFITKPFKPEALIRKTAELLNANF